MPRLQGDSEEAKRIDAAMSKWRQGDVALDEQWFVHVGDSSAPLTDAAADGADGIQALTTEVAGLVVVTQTCDVVRHCMLKQFIEVVPLVEVSAEDLRQIQRGRRPTHAVLPAVMSKHLVAHLERVMTVEKSVAAGWIRTPGCTSDAEARAFAQALARKRSRFAFPDDFNHLAKKLVDRLREKHDKHTDEGRALQSLREIRVQASPAWGASIVSIFFWFIRDEDQPAFEGRSWDELCKAWLKLIPISGRFATIRGQVATLDDLRGSDYVNSDPLDLDHLSSSAL